jgi:hypothetical protein
MSKKFTLITFQIQDGDYEYFNYKSFLTSDIQKMNDMQIVSYFFKKNMNEVLMQDDGAYWIDDTRTSYVFDHKTISLEEHDLLEKLEILFSKPKQLLKKESNVIQLKRKVG